MIKQCQLRASPSRCLVEVPSGLPLMACGIPLGLRTGVRDQKRYVNGAHCDAETVQLDELGRLQTAPSC